MVFEKALTNFKSYDNRKAQFSTWVFTIARNTLTDYVRTHFKKQTVTLDDPAAAIPIAAKNAGASRRPHRVSLVLSAMGKTP